jgi:hypothetical protein
MLFLEEVLLRPVDRITDFPEVVDEAIAVSVAGRLKKSFALLVGDDVDDFLFEPLLVSFREGNFGFCGGLHHEARREQGDTTWAKKAHALIIVSWKTKGRRVRRPHRCAGAGYDRPDF